MSQTNPAVRTAARYPRGALSQRTLFQLAEQFNDLVKDTHDFCALLDADTGVTAVDYEATLTAAQLDFAGYTNGVASPAPVKGLFGEFELDVNEEFASALNDQIEALRVDYSAIVAKLTADVLSVVATNAVRTANRLIERLTTANAGVAQDSIACFLTLAGRGPGQTGIILAAGAPDTGLAGKIMRSLDDGRTWTPWATLPVAVVSVVGMIQVGETLFLAGSTAAAGVIYTSTDFGLTWSLVAHGVTITSTAFTDILVSRAGSILVSGNAGGEVLRSTDGGSTWNLVSIVGPAVVNSLAELRDGSKMFACGGNAILYSSTDDGASFAAEKDFSVGHTDCRHFLELANGYWLVTTWVNLGTDELQVSQDAGATWGVPVAVAGASNGLGKMAQSPDGTVIIAVGADAQISDDNGATVEAAAVGPVFPVNDTVVAGFGKTRTGQLLAGTTNATDGAGIWLVGVTLPAAIAAYNVAPSTGGPILTQTGGGVDARWLEAARRSYEALLEAWQTFGAYCDDDATVATATYEAAIAAKFITPEVQEPASQQHNVGHGAAA